MHGQFTFRVINSRKSLPEIRSNTAYLEIDNWNDWGVYRTQYYLTYADHNADQIVIGSVKIAELNQATDRPALPDTPFTGLPKTFASIGQSREYYENLMKLDSDIRMQILVGLQDLAHEFRGFTIFENQDVLRRSLLRDFTVSLVKGQFHRILQGQPALTEFNFGFALNSEAVALEPEFTFDVEPHTNPPTNIHAIIGKNGVGKTHLLTRMASSYLYPESNSFGTFVTHRWPMSLKTSDLFSNIIVVAFSLFDPFEKLLESSKSKEHFIHIGISQASQTDPSRTQLDAFRSQFDAKFRAAIGKCIANNSVERFKRVCEPLKSDPILAKFLDQLFENFAVETGNLNFMSLSSGHKIVCLTIAQLVAGTTERSLILIDEPETHLHPPLLSSLIRSLSDLVIDRNAVAIIATHSPVVLQEIPKSCVWIMQRSGETSQQLSRPVSETFGENVGNLTRDVFQLEVKESGFHKLIKSAAEEETEYEAAEAKFDDRSLGSEARIVLRSLVQNNKNR